MAHGGIGEVPLSIGDSTCNHVDILNDPVIQQMAAKFEQNVTIKEDIALEVDASEVVPCDSDSSNSSSVKENDELYDDNLQPKPLIKNNNLKKMNSRKLSRTKSDSKNYTRLASEGSYIKTAEVDKDRSSPDTQSIASEHGCSPVKGKNPLKMLKKLTKFDKSTKNPNFRSKFTLVSTGRLPQAFVVKYLGHRDVMGVCGLHHVRKPVDEIVAAMKTKIEAKEELNLPLLYVIVSSKGLNLRVHHTNKVTVTAPLGAVPIEYISYGVQDMKYWSIFTFIIVRALSRQARAATCHVLLCDSAHGGRRMALALGAAFEVYSKKLQAAGGSKGFKIELRPPDELAEGMQECDV